MNCIPLYVMLFHGFMLLFYIEGSLYFQGLIGVGLKRVEPLMSSKFTKRVSSARARYHSHTSSSLARSHDNRRRVRAKPALFIRARLVLHL